MAMDSQKPPSALVDAAADLGSRWEILDTGITVKLYPSCGREALGIALTGMMRDGEVSRVRAQELARMVLRENARRLYGL